jgi:hypothetical protein
MDKLTELVYKLNDVTQYGIMDLTDQLEEVGITYSTPDDEHFYWYSDDIELGEDEYGAYDIDELPYVNGAVNQKVYDTLVDVITQYINEQTN